MTAPSNPTQPNKKRPRGVLLLGAAALAVTLGAVIYFSVSGNTVQQSATFETRRGDFLISVVEGGTIEAVNEVVIRSEVEGTSRIIFIVPEGSYVRRGDLLVELDSSAAQDAVNLQQINVEKAEFALIQARQQLDIQSSVVDSDTAAAELKFALAKEDLKKFQEAEEEQTRRNAEIDIATVEENLKIAEERLEWTRKLYEKKFETKANLDKDELAVSQTTLKLEQAKTALKIIKEFDLRKKKLQLEAAAKEAGDELERVKLQGDRKLKQFQADVQTQERTLKLSQDKLARDRKQLEAAKIYAPQGGLVVYATGGNRFSSESMIEEGAVIRNRQEIIKLPDVSDMKLQVKIHESHINDIRRGQPAYVVLDSMPDRRFQGVVSKVAPLPDSASRWANPNLKVYATEILVTEKLPDVKPGVSARAEVVVTNIANALTVPIQAVTTHKGKQVVYLAGATPKPMPVSVGLYNTKFIEITSGLNEGDAVLLSPPFDADSKDLGGSIISKGDALPTATNQLDRIRQEPGGDEGSRFTGPANGGNRRGPSPDGQARPDSTPQTPLVAGNGEQAQREAFNSGRREEMMKQFDTNGDGQLDETERAAMRERFGRNRRNNPSGEDGQASQPARAPQAVQQPALTE